MRWSPGRRAIPGNGCGSADAKFLSRPQANETGIERAAVELLGRSGGEGGDRRHDDHEDAGDLVDAVDTVTPETA